jgi:hypothetical protein
MKKSPEPQFTPEQELLLWSIRVDHAKDQRISEILTGGVDWTYVRETAIQHGIIPLLYKRLKEDMIDLVPPDELAELRTLFMENAARNLRMTQELFKVLDLLAEAGIEAMPFKGPALAIQAYGDLSMRSFCDLDILIHEKDFDRVYKLLVDNRFTPYIQIDSEIKKKFVILQKDLSFSRHDIHIEIHWRIAERFFVVPIDLEKVWNQNKSILLNNREIQTFNPEDVLILLCIHGSLHFWQDLKWISDLNYLIKNHLDLKWDQIIHRSEKMGIRRIFTISLLLADEFGGIIFPLIIKKILSSDEISQNLTISISPNFFLQNKIILTPPLHYMKSRERVRDQINYGLRCITCGILTPNRYDFKFIALPSLLFPLYFLIRPFRILMEHVPPLLKSPVR